MKFFFALILLSVLCLHAQEQPLKLDGKVSYISGQSVYVQFENTKGIKAEDTLFIGKAGKLVPALIAKFLSSRSVSCAPIIADPVPVGTTVYALAAVEMPPPAAVTEIKRDTAVVENFRRENKRESGKSSVIGRVSLQSSADFSAVSAYNSQRYRASFNLSADNIGVQNLHFSNYMTLTVRNREWEEFKPNPLKNLRVYDLGARYTPDSVTTFFLGRHLHAKTSSIGAIDGLLAERKSGHFSYGATIGSRPDWNDYGFNMKLFQMGVFASHEVRTVEHDVETTIGLFNQTNNFRTDRRFIYIQHSNNLIPDGSMFFSNELDLYGMNNGTAGTKLTLTSIYAMLRYAPARSFSFYVSYDARKNVIFYETFKSYIETLLENTMRQGVRVQAMIRPADRLITGVSAGYRFQKSDARPSGDYGGYAVYTGLPAIQGDLSLNTTYLQSSFLNGLTADISYSRTFGDELYTSTGYRMFRSKYITVSAEYIQNTVYTNISYPLMKDFLASLSYEGVFEKSGNTSRVYIDLTRRF